MDIRCHRCFPDAIRVYRDESQQRFAWWRETRRHASDRTSPDRNTIVAICSLDMTQKGKIALTPLFNYYVIPAFRAIDQFAKVEKERSLITTFLLTKKRCPSFFSDLQQLLRVLCYHKDAISASGAQQHVLLDEVARALTAIVAVIRVELATDLNALECLEELTKASSIKEAWWNG